MTEQAAERSMDERIQAYHELMRAKEERFEAAQKLMPGGVSAWFWPWPPREGAVVLSLESFEALAEMLQHVRY